MALLKIWHI